MKPGNLFIQGAKSGGRRKMRIPVGRFRIFAESVIFYANISIRKEHYHGKKTVYF